MKPIKGFRLDEETQIQIAWLAERKKVTATDVVRMAIAEMFHREMDRLPKFRLGDDGILYLNEKPVIHCSDKLLTELPEHFLLRLEAGTADATETMIALLLTAARVKEDLEINDMILEEETGFNPRWFIQKGRQ